MIKVDQVFVIFVFIVLCSVFFSPSHGSKCVLLFSWNWQFQWVKSSLFCNIKCFCIFIDFYLHKEVCKRKMHQDKKTTHKIEPIRRRNQRLLARAQLASIPLLGMALILVQPSTLKLAPHVTPSLSTISIAFMLFLGCSRLLSPVSLWNILPATNYTALNTSYITCLSLSNVSCVFALPVGKGANDLAYTSDITAEPVFPSKDSPPSELKVEKTEEVWVS